MFKYYVREARKHFLKYPESANFWLPKMTRLIFRGEIITIKIGSFFYCMIAEKAVQIFI